MRRATALASSAGPPSKSFCRQPAGGSSWHGVVGGDGLDAARLDPGLHAGDGRAVDGEIAEEAQQALGAVATARELEQLGRLVDEARVDVATEEARMAEHVVQEGDVRRHAAHAELGERAMHLLSGGVEVPRVAGHLDQQRVVVGGDGGAGVAGAAVEPDPHAAGAAEDLEPADPRLEPLGGILGGDAALDGGAANVDRVLAQADVVERLTAAMRICACTKSTPVTSSVTVCSTWMRGLASMKKWLPLPSTRNSNVPALR